MKYLAQAIVIDNTGRNTIEAVIDSIKTDDYRATVEFMMRRHKSSHHYRYTVIEIETQTVVFNTTRNIFGW